MSGEPGEYNGSQAEIAAREWVSRMTGRHAPDVSDEDHVVWAGTTAGFDEVGAAICVTCGHLLVRSTSTGPWRHLDTEREPLSHEQEVTRALRRLQAAEPIKSVAYQPEAAKEAINDLRAVLLDLAKRAGV